MSEMETFGLPDYGPEDDMRCFECGAPVDSDYNSIVKYSGPVTQIFSSCFNCGAPDITPIGACPSCRGYVFEFEDKYACFNETIGCCNFSICKSELEEIGIWVSVRNQMANLLVSPKTCVFYDEHDNYEKTLQAELSCSEHKKWFVNIVDVTY